MAGWSREGNNHKTKYFIIKKLFKGRAIIIYGDRQVGKTTLIKKIMDVCDIPSKYLNYDEPDIRESLSNKTSTELSQLIGSNKLVLIERYVVPKAFRDNYPDADVHLVNRDNHMDFLL